MKHIKNWKLFESNITDSSDDSSVAMDSSSCEIDATGSVYNKDKSKWIDSGGEEILGDFENFETEIRHSIIDGRTEDVKNAIDKIVDFRLPFRKKRQDGAIRNFISSWAAEYGRKEVLSYMAENGLLSKSDIDFAIEWMKHTRKITEEQKEEIRDLLKNL